MGNRSISTATKDAVIADAMARIMAGDTLEQIAVSNDISPRTLDIWLAALGDEYQVLRSAWVDQMLQKAKDEIDNCLRQCSMLDKDGMPLLDEQGEEKIDPDRQLRLARARELWRSAEFIAKTRDRARYGADKAVVVNIGVGVAMDTALVSEASALLEQIKV